MARRRASVATMSRPMGSTQDVTKAIRLVFSFEFLLLTELGISTGLAFYVPHY